MKWIEATKLWNYTANFPVNTERLSFCIPFAKSGNGSVLGIVVVMKQCLNESQSTHESAVWYWSFVLNSCRRAVQTSSRKFECPWLRILSLPNMVANVCKLRSQNTENDVAWSAQVREVGPTL